MHGKPRQDKERDWISGHALGDPLGRIGVPHFARNDRIKPDNRFTAQAHIGSG